jgi:hypothetical protein
MLYEVLYIGVWSVFYILVYYDFIFLGPNMANKRKSESDEGGCRRKRKPVDL